MHAPHLPPHPNLPYKQPPYPPTHHRSSFQHRLLHRRAEVREEAVLERADERGQEPAEGEAALGEGEHVEPDLPVPAALVADGEALLPCVCMVGIVCGCGLYVCVQVAEGRTFRVSKKREPHDAPSSRCPCSVETATAATEPCFPQGFSWHRTLRSGFIVQKSP